MASQAVSSLAPGIDTAYEAMLHVAQVQQNKSPLNGSEPLAARDIETYNPRFEKQLGSWKPK